MTCRPRGFALVCLLAVVALVPAPRLRAEPAERQAAPTTDQSVQSPAVATMLVDWTDARRDRKVPAKIYYPKTPAGRSPVILFSHGLGGSREGYAYLGEEWASHGYVSVHLQHIGSDDGVWKDLPPGQRMAAMRKAATSPANAADRPRDVSFAIDQLQKLNEQDGPLKGRLDPGRIGVAGHSFGAYTVLAVIGEVFAPPDGKEVSAADPRVKAAVSMSAPVPRDSSRYDQAFAKIAVPCLHMTGTLDDSPIGDTRAKDRRVPFDHIPANSDQYLIVFTGGDHMVFSGRGTLTARAAKDAAFQDVIRRTTTTFWDAYLRGDRSARSWMSGPKAKEFVGDKGTYEMKQTKPGK